MSGSLGVGLLGVFCLLSLLSGCSGPAPIDAPLQAARPVDFSGEWEVDYSLSDTVQSQFAVLVRQLQNEQARRERAGERGGSTMAMGRPTVNTEAIYGLAQMAELITESSLLSVVQSSQEIRVGRENNFALVCDLTRPQPVITQSLFGAESCGWDGHQLVFTVALPEGLTVRHRITRSTTQAILVVVTTVDSAAVSAPFALRKVYRRYDPTNTGFRCVDTLSKGRVCTTETLESEGE